MTTRNFPYLKFRLKNRGRPNIDPVTGQDRKIPNTDYSQSIPQLLAYSGCAKVRDESTGRLYNYCRKNHLLHTHVAVPSGCSWASDREFFANAIMQKETHPRARLGRDAVGARPKGMSTSAFKGASVAFANSISMMLNTAVFVDIHDAHKKAPDLDESEHNVHAHFFFATREVTPEGFGKKLRELDLNTRSSKIIEAMRKEWARCLEHAFKLQGDHDIKIEHRSYKRQGINKEAQPKIGAAAHAMHARGEQTDRMKLFEEVERHNELIDELEAEEKALEAEIERLEALPNTRLPKRCIGSYTIDDHVHQRSYLGTHAYAQRTYDWLTEHYGHESMLTGLFEDFELLLDGPSPEEEKIPELPPEPTISDLFESIAMWIDRQELRKRPRPHYARKWERQQGDGRNRSYPALVGPER